MHDTPFISTKSTGKVLCQSCKLNHSKRIFGIYFQEHHYHDWASVCYGLACRNPDTKTCQMTLPHDGTPCGNKHVCI